MEKYREKKEDLHIVFIDLERVYDRLSRDFIWWVLEKKGVTKGYVVVVKDIYDGAVTTIRSPDGESSEFPITVAYTNGQP